MIRKKNLYSRPRKPFEKQRISDENELAKKYGLKNKKEIWKTSAKLNYFRKRAMVLANEPVEEQEVLFGKLKNMGLKVTNIADILGLKVEDLLDRRLPTVVAKKKIANTVKHARQMVVHKKVLINGSVVNSPSYIVMVSEEDSIKLKEKSKKPVEVPEEKVEEQEVEESENLESSEGETE